MSKFSIQLKTFPVLETPRLILRQLAESDAPAYFAQISALPPTSSWTQSHESQSLVNCRAAIRSYNNVFDRTKTVIPWAIIDKNGVLIGFLKIFDIQNRSKAELSHWLGQSHWGQGLMLEAVSCAMQFAFAELEMHRTYATTRSANVVEKAGFQKEGILRQQSRLDET